LGRIGFCCDGGGELVAIERARPLLDTVAKRVIYTGSIGTGSIAKIMHHSASFTLDLVMAERWTAGDKAGIDAAPIVKVLNEAALGQMMSLEVRLPATYLRGGSSRAFRSHWRARIWGSRSSSRARAPPIRQCLSMRFANRR
jgi:3-hydroxyisobutyrate dehydrogenase-like beta-hydroxyacid dehydrogenase